VQEILDDLVASWKARRGSWIAIARELRGAEVQVELLHLRCPNHGKVFRRLLANLGGFSAREVRGHLGVSSEAATQ
jgi:hypothetical protein